MDSFIQREVEASVRLDGDTHTYGPEVCSCGVVHKDIEHYCVNCGLSMTDDKPKARAYDDRPVCHLSVQDCVELMKARISELEGQLELADASYEAWCALDFRGVVSGSVISVHRAAKAYEQARGKQKGEDNANG